MKLLRKLLRYFCSNFHVRGRFRLANSVGKLLAPSNHFETINVYGTYIPIDHSIAMYRYVYYGVYEEYFINFLKRILKSGDIVIEPGVNIGYVTAILSSLVGSSGKIFAIEPSRICFEKIQTYLINPNIKLLNKALSDKTGESAFIDKGIVISHGYSTLSEFTKKESGDSEYLIPITSVDDLMLEHMIDHIRLLKLDIEGAELLALKGSSNALSNKKIDYVLVETTFNNENHKTNKLIEHEFFKNGYKPYLMLRNQIKLVDLDSILNSRHDIIWTHLK